nr:D-3-phosphoglycerate dehydrogenase 2, chloroplastic [Tanacetum cinerariifolium]
PQFPCYKTTTVSNVLKTSTPSVSSDLESLFSNSKPTILVSEKLGDGGLDLLRAFANVDCSYSLSPEELCSKITMCDALIVRSGTKVTRQVFEASKGRLKVVGRAGVGIDNVDLQAATEFGCLVVNAPTANTIAAAEHGIALLSAMARNVAQADASMKAGKWERSKYVGVSMVGKCLAIMGFGKVGSEVARRAKGLGMHVVAHDPYAPADRAHLESLFSNSKPTILVSEKLGDGGLDLLRAFANVDCSYSLSPEELCSKITMCDALIVRSGTKVTRQVFEASKGRLKVVGRAGVGIDNVDLQAATEVT